MARLSNIVLVHGAWADGSCWSGVIEQLQLEGYRVTAPQFPLTSLADDVARLREVLALSARSRATDSLICRSHHRFIDAHHCAGSDSHVLVRYRFSSECSAVQLVIVLPLRLALGDCAKTLRELLCLAAFVVEKSLLRGRHAGIHNTEVSDHDVAAGVVTIGEDTSLHEAHRFLARLEGIPLSRQGDQRLGVVRAESNGLHENVLHGQSACQSRYELCKQVWRVAYWQSLPI
jgi:hypothetical protein